MEYIKGQIRGQKTFLPDCIDDMVGGQRWDLNPYDCPYASSGEVISVSTDNDFI